MKVEGMTALQARALFGKGITNAKELAEASLDKLKEALQSAAPSDRRRKKAKGGAKAPGLNALGSSRAVDRTAEALVRAALRHLVEAAEESASAAAGAEASAAAILGASDHVHAGTASIEPLLSPSRPTTPAAASESVAAKAVRSSSTSSGWTRFVRAPTAAHTPGTLVMLE
eukprot:scaffold121238_cov36-Prasinocladus_malaysianus.AAC.1